MKHQSLGQLHAFGEAHLELLQTRLMHVHRVGRWADLLERQPYLTIFAGLLLLAGSASAAGGDHFPSYEPGVTSPVRQDTTTTTDQGTTANIDQGATTAIDPGTTASIPDTQKDSLLKRLLHSNVKVPPSNERVWGD